MAPPPRAGLGSSGLGPRGDPRPLAGGPEWPPRGPPLLFTGRTARSGAAAALTASRKCTRRRVPRARQGHKGPGAQGRRCERTPLLGGERCEVALQRARVARGASDCGRLRRRTAPRRRNSHRAQFTHFQGAVSWCLVYLQGCASSPQSVLEYCLNPRKKSHAHQRPFSLSPQPPRPHRRPPPAHAPSPEARGPRLFAVQPPARPLLLKGRCEAHGPTRGRALFYLLKRPRRCFRHSPEGEANGRRGQGLCSSRRCPGPGVKRPLGAAPRGGARCGWEGFPAARLASTRDVLASDFM